VTFEIVADVKASRVIITVRPPWSFIIKTAVFLWEESAKIEPWLELMARQYWASELPRVGEESSMSEGRE
jgi:hypothetical protein